MKYTSTRNDALRVDSGFAITHGISEDGGLFVPAELPKTDAAFIEKLCGMSYTERANAVLSLFLSDFTKEEIESCTVGAYGSGFEGESPAPVVRLHDNVNILELWHGPTCAFKDMALQLLPYLLSCSAKRFAGGRQTVILVATSGDTGKAALEGFKDVPGTKILVFYPSDGVSPVQKLQMTTQQGENVGVCAIYGNFDDAQTGVKKIFTDEGIKAELESHGMEFSSANSINWGRLVPQIVYYFSAYADMIKSGQIKNGEKINFTVPTGNFGNILAAYYAREMGLPVNKLICASNANNVLTEFLTTGRYNRLREFHTTVSPSMDILISSNLERLLFHLTDGGSKEINRLFSLLGEKGEYTVDDKLLSGLQAVFAAGFCTDDDTKAVIRETFEKYGYLCDTHTGVGIAVYNEYRKNTGDSTPTVIASTASPYKFSAAVDSALEPEKPGVPDEFELIRRIEKLSGTTAPAQLKSLEGAVPRFTNCCTKDEMKSVVFSLLGI